MSPSACDRESWGIGDVPPGPHGPDRPPSKVSGSSWCGISEMMTLTLVCWQGTLKDWDPELKLRRLPGDPRCPMHGSLSFLASTGGTICDFWVRRGSRGQSWAGRGRGVKVGLGYGWGPETVSFLLVRRVPAFGSWSVLVRGGGRGTGNGAAGVAFSSS